MAATPKKAAAKVAQFKLVLLGQAAVGKSSIVLRFVKDEFQDFQEATIGAAFCTKTMSLESGAVCKYEVWDTAGQERYESLAPMYYRGAHAAIVVFDITSLESFEKSQKWVRDLGKQGNPNIVVCLVGNKLDMAADRQVPTDMAAKYAADNGILFIESSAKSGENIAAIFARIADKLPVGAAPEAEPAGTETLDGGGNGGNGGGGGCCTIQ
eukprot:c45593_g1_i1.p1 GENE.c45593_g1_i1~~c45593_g1_i1.p1  ORF type:complete len:211 (-),score=56.35 c45593_g1_i1:172-804(-)